MAKKNARLYCAVFGCLNSTLTHPDMTLFKLPAANDRRLEWLHLIAREDLEEKTKYGAYRVCEKHFNVEDIKQSPNRKLLKNNTVPSLMLPIISRTDDKQFQSLSEVSFGNNKFTQTENATTESYAQTLTSISFNLSRIKKLEAELLRCKNKIKLLETRNKKRKCMKKVINSNGHEERP